MKELDDNKHQLFEQIGKFLSILHLKSKKEDLERFENLRNVANLKSILKRLEVWNIALVKYEHIELKSALDSSR